MLMSMTEGVQKSTAAPVLGLAALGEVVTISIGTDQKIYHVHKDLICHYSEYFRTAYNGRWREAQDGVALEFVEAEVFNIFVHWIYALRLPESAEDLLRITGASKNDLVDVGKWEQRKMILLSLLKSCVFGDGFLAPEFCKDVHNRLVNMLQTTSPFYEHVKYAFDNLNEDHLLLKYFVDLQCTNWTQTDDKFDGELQARELVPSRFFIKVMIRNDEYNKGFADKKIRLCDYHLHDSDQERGACPQFKAS
ncbi:hypothetical protein HBI23_168830 [Parastagonospora nodorum]|nr:hypothetical protein HBI47_031990 [Parastagonospora nodorum]KAH5651660.1 hypothetical protein HBI23_168830 [Parastagonospora nodorum]